MWPGINKVKKFKLPILESVHKVLYKNADPENLVSNILKKGMISSLQPKPLNISTIQVMSLQNYGDF